MQLETIIAGFGGQGVLFAGQLLAHAGLDAGKNVTWIPSYGPEMRGGTAHVTVIISDEEIGSPLVHRPAAVVALNNPSLEKYEGLVKSGGLLIYNSSLLSKTFQPHRDDIALIPVPATEIATDLGDARMANMVSLGALIGATAVLPLARLSEALPQHLLKDRFDLVPPNIAALESGQKIGSRVAA